jgi:hypothetical protein
MTLSAKKTDELFKIPLTRVSQSVVVALLEEFSAETFHMTAAPYRKTPAL